MRRPALAAATLVVALIAIGRARAAEPKPSPDLKQMKADTEMLKDEPKAIAEFERRLHRGVAYRGGLLVIEDPHAPATGVTIAPATVTWAIHCGAIGLAVIFGSGTGVSDNGIALTLTNAAIGDAQCRRIAPSVGETMLAIAAGR